VIAPQFCATNGPLARALVVFQNDRQRVGGARRQRGQR
jgi:hypothetical protein